MPNELDILWGSHKDKINVLVYESVDFIVYVTHHNIIWWETSNAHDESKIGKEDSEKWNDFLNKSARVDTLPCSHLETVVLIDFKRLIGEATARALSFQYESAAKMLVDAESFLTDRNKELSRFWYLSSSIVLTSIVLVIGFLIWENQGVIIAREGSALFWLLISAVMGALGALLSIILRMGKAELNCSSGLPLHILESGSRIIAGCLSGVLAMLAIKSGVIGDSVLQINSSIAPQMLFALVAGASERLIPSLISKIESSD